MSRRYLSILEAESRITAGRSVECFLGPCQRGDSIGVRWCSVALSSDKNFVVIRRYDSADVGTIDFYDLYEFGPLDPALEQDEADETLQFDEFNELWKFMESRFPESTSRLVNQGVLQDEYLNFKVQHHAV